MNYSVQISTKIIFKNVLNNSVDLTSTPSTTTTTTTTENNNNITESMLVDETVHENNLLDDLEPMELEQQASMTKIEDQIASANYVEEELSNDSYMTADRVFNTDQNNLDEQMIILHSQLEVEEEQQQQSIILTRHKILKKKTRKSRSKRAGLHLPVSKVHKHLKLRLIGQRVLSSSSIQLTGILEYLVAELIDTSGEETHKANENIIIPKHIYLATQNDNDFKILFDKVTFN
jgi:histone H2A